MHSIVLAFTAFVAGELRDDAHPVAGNLLRSDQLEVSVMRADVYSSHVSGCLYSQPLRRLSRGRSSVVSQFEMRSKH